MLNILNPYIPSVTPTLFTTGSVIFAGTSGILSEDNANFFWDDTNNRLGIGTASPSAKVHVDGTPDEVKLRLQGGTSQSNSILDIRNSSSTSMTFVGSNGILTVAGHAQTISAGTNIVTLGAGSTITVSGSATTTGLTGNPAFTYTVDQGFSSNYFFQHSAVYSNAVSLSGGTQGLFHGSFYNVPIFRANTNSFSTAAVGTGFWDQPTFTIASGGTLAVNEWNGFIAAGSSATGVTITNRRGFYVQNMSGGTITTQTGIELDDITVGTTKIAIRQKGTTGHNRFQAQTSFGQDFAPSGQVDVIIGSSSREGLFVKAAASQSANMINCYDSSAASLTAVTGIGNVLIANSNQTITASNVYLSMNVSKTANVTTDNINYIGIKGAGTVNFTSDQTAGTQNFMLHQATYKNDSSVTSVLNLLHYSFQNSPTFQADTNAITGFAVANGYIDSPTFNRINSGTLTVTEWNSFQAAGTNNTGSTITNRRGMFIRNMAGGTITTQTGLEIDDISTGTTKIAVRVKGTTGHIRLVPKTMVGSDSASTLQLQVGAGAYGGNLDTMTYANPLTLTTTNGNIHKTTTTAGVGNATINASDAGVAGQHMWILLVNDATAGRTITFGTNFVSTGTQAIGGVNKRATTHWISDGVNWFEVSRQNNL